MDSATSSCAVEMLGRRQIAERVLATHRSRAAHAADVDPRIRRNAARGRVRPADGAPLSGNRAPRSATPRATRRRDARVFAARRVDRRESRASATSSSRFARPSRCSRRWRARRGVTIRTRFPDGALRASTAMRAFTRLRIWSRTPSSTAATMGTVEVSCIAERAIHHDIRRRRWMRHRARIARSDFSDGRARSERRDSGCGIGLAIVKAIANAQAAMFGSSASPLGGARFVLRFLAG